MSKTWVTRFVNRHSIHLISHTVNLDSNRHRADSGAEYSRYFDLLHHKISQYNIEPCHSYNMDEKGLIGITGRSKRVCSRRMWEQKEVRATIQDGPHEWTLWLACALMDQCYRQASSIRLPVELYNQAGRGHQVRGSLSTRRPIAVRLDKQ